MKLKLLTLVVFTVCIFGCQTENLSTTNFNGNVVTITVTASSKKPFPPIVSDSQGHKADTEADNNELTTYGKPGDMIQWNFSGDISKIDAIQFKNGENLFVESPKKGKNGTWFCIISNNRSNSNVGSYDIIYRVDGKQYIQDPKIKIDPTD